jgi:ferredoxin-type protein NapH
VAGFWLELPADGLSVGHHLLTYLLPPATIWGGLLHGTLTPTRRASLALPRDFFTLEFAFARHLFCRFGCAVGLFQSLAWMANPAGHGGGV